MSWGTSLSACLVMNPWYPQGHGGSLYRPLNEGDGCAWFMLPVYVDIHTGGSLVWVLVDRGRGGEEGCKNPVFEWTSYMDGPLRNIITINT